MLLSWHVDDQLDDGLNHLLTGVLNDATNMSRCLSAPHFLPQYDVQYNLLRLLSLLY